MTTLFEYLIMIPKKVRHTKSILFKQIEQVLITTNWLDTNTWDDTDTWVDL